LEFALGIVLHRVQLAFHSIFVTLLPGNNGQGRMGHRGTSLALQGLGECRPGLIEAIEAGIGITYIRISAGAVGIELRCLPGIVERILQRFAEDPMRFFRLAHEALGAGDLELVDSEISRLVRRSREPALRGMLRQVRESVTNEELRESVERLRVVLQREGFVANHAVMTALQTRVLRPGTNEDFDTELDAVLTEWRSEEERLGIEIDLRVIAYVFGRHRKLHRALPFLPELNLEDPQWRYQAYASILWPRGNVVRTHTLSWWNPFSTPLPPDRFLVLDCLEEARDVVDIEDAAWREKVRQLLADRAEASLLAPVDQPLALRRAILSLVAEPLEVGFLHVFPKIEGARRDGNTLELRVVCREAIR